MKHIYYFFKGAAQALFTAFICLFLMTTLPVWLPACVFYRIGKGEIKL